MNKFPFTATQWQELEHQALIFKYMVSGIPIPPDLLYALKRSYLDPNNSSKLLISHHPQHVGWNCFQMGLGRKVDPEPGRCRRTDGKKWRCSKEAFPESKYCERHMHRGKNRSRKPVEVLKTQNGGTVTSTTTSSVLTNSLSSDHTQHRQNLHFYPCYNGSVVDQNPSRVYHQYHHSPSTRPPNNGAIGLSSQDIDSNNTASLLFDSDSRYVYGLKEEVDEHAFFSEEPSRTSWQLTPLAISCSSSSSSSSSSSKHGHEHCYLQLQSAHYSHKQDQCDLVGRDIVKLDKREDQIQTQKTIRFFDEWPMKQKDSWLELDEKSTDANRGSVSTTQLSISMPKASYDFPIFSSRTPNGE